MGDLIPIRCNNCGNEFEADKEKMEVYLKYPETDPGVLYNLASMLSRSPICYYKAKCPKCEAMNYIEK